LERFESDLRSLKTELLFTANGEHAYGKLSQFVRKIDDPYLTNIVREQFAELTAAVSPSGSAVEISLDHPLTGVKMQRPLKSALAEMYQRLKDNFETPDVKEARSIMESAAYQIGSPKMFIDLVTQNATDLLGREHAVYLNDTDTFFEKHTEHKPADFVDEEAAQEYKEDATGGLPNMHKN
jgi:hypothetical protein